MTETLDSISLKDVNAFRASELTIGRSIRDYMRTHLFADAETLATAINGELTAAEQIAVPSIFDEANTYLDFSQVLPQIPPFVHVLVPRWRRLEGHRKVRQYDTFVMMVTGLECTRESGARARRGRGGVGADVRFAAQGAHHGFG